MILLLLYFSFLHWKRLYVKFKKIKILKTTVHVHINSILVVLFGIHLLSHADIYSLYRGIFCDCASGLCSL